MEAVVVLLYASVLFTVLVFLSYRFLSKTLCGMFERVAHVNIRLDGSR